MNSFYGMINRKIFRIMTALLALAGDIVICRHLFSLFNDYQLYKNLMREALKSNGLTFADLPANFLTEQYQIFLKTLTIMLTSVILLHFIIYLFYLANKKFAFKYVRFLSIMGIPTCAYFATQIDPSNTISFSTMVGAAVGYLFIMLGVFSGQKYEETLPATTAVVTEESSEVETTEEAAPAVEETNEGTGEWNFEHTRPKLPDLPKEDDSEN